jgi:nicotinamide-nucleotide amidase
MHKQKSKIFLSKGNRGPIVVKDQVCEVVMKIGLLIIGNEILEGKITDANTRQLSLFLKNHNLELQTSLTVKDQEHLIHQGLSILFNQCDVIITSGGLGPTKDDLTKEAIASFLGRSIAFSELSLEVATKNYLRFNRPAPHKDHGYCFLPQGFRPLENSTGFAPGLFTEHEGKFLLCGPGVPWEFKSLLEDHFIDLVQSRFPSSREVIESLNFRTKGIPEEKIFKEIDPTLWDKLSSYGVVSSLPQVMSVDIGVKLMASNPQEMEIKKQKIIEIITKSPVSKSLWQIGNLSLEETIVKFANKKNITFSFAESATGGLCSHRITNVPGSSQTFLGSIVSYAEVIKENILEVKSSTIQSHGVVSQATAEEMSSGLGKKFHSDISISITGIAGPGGGSPEKPVGTVCIGVTTKDKTQSHLLHMPGDREQLKVRFSQAALFYLLEELEHFSQT